MVMLKAGNKRRLYEYARADDFVGVRKRKPGRQTR